MHEAAQQLVDQAWPRELEGWMALPGIGRTTAGSIVSSAFNAPEPILDGNVKRVLARLLAHPTHPPAIQRCSGGGVEACWISSGPVISTRR